jgi:uncharacterized protein
MAKSKNLFAYTQLSTGNTARAKKFYKSLFAWKVSDVKMGPGMTYTMIDTGSDEAGAGIQKKETAKAPSMWLSYVEVADVKETVAKAKKMGAKVVVAYPPIPEMGAFGIFKDPGGALLGVWEQEKVTRPAKKRRR